MMQRYFDFGDLYQFFYHLLDRITFKAMPFPWLFFIARMRGNYRYYFNRTLRDVVFTNVYQAFADKQSEKELLRLTRTILQTVQILDVCAYFLQKLNDEQIRKWFPVRGWENLEKALKANKGVILLSGHLGPHYIIRYLLRQRGYDVRGLRFKGMKKQNSRVPKKSRFAKFINRKIRLKRFKEASECYFEVDFNARPVLKFLNENGVLFTMGDGVHSLTYKEVEFLNNKIPFSLGTMSLARTSGSVVLPLIVKGQPGTRNFEAVIGEPFEMQVSRDRQEDVIQNTLKYVRCLEEQITEHPYNWRNWMYRDYFSRISEFFSEESDRHSKVFGHGLTT